MKASTIHSKLEHLSTLPEFDEFVEGNLISKIQFSELPKLEMDPLYFSDYFRQYSPFPIDGWLRSARLVLSQGQFPENWDFIANCKKGKNNFRLEGNKNAFRAYKNNILIENQDPQSRDPRLVHHFLNGVYNASFDNVFNEESLKKMELESYQSEISADFIGSLSAFSSNSEKISRTRLLSCPNNFALVASVLAKETKGASTTDIYLDFFTQLSGKMLIYRYMTLLGKNSSAGGLKSSKVLWQVTDGRVNELPDDIDIEPALEGAEELDPLDHFEAWKQFMEIADESIGFVMRKP